MAMAHNRWTCRWALALATALGVGPSGCSRDAAPEPPPRPAEPIKRACALFAAGQYDRAAAQFEHILKNWPTAIEARQHYAYTLAALGRFDEVDEILRTAPESQQTGLQSLRRGFNIYRHYYHAADPNPKGVFRVGIIRDALDASAFEGLTVTDLREVMLFRLADMADLLQLWVRWDQVAREPEQAPGREWLPLLMVAEPNRLRERADQLPALEQQAEGEVWIHPDDSGNWIAHAGAMNVEKPLASPTVRSSRVASELTETTEPGNNLIDGWRCVTDWLSEELPDATVVLAAAIRPAADRPFDRRLALVGRLQAGQIRLGRIVTHSAGDPLLWGYRAYHALLSSTSPVSARSSLELEAFARTWTSAGLPATAFHVDERRRIVADDPNQLACLLSLVRYGRALFEPTESPTTAPK